MSNAVEKYQKAQHLQLTDKLLVEMRGHTALLTLNITPPRILGTRKCCRA